MSRAGQHLLEIIASEYDEGDVVGLFVGAPEVVKVQLRTVDMDKGLIFGSYWPSERPLCYRASCVQGVVELEVFGDEE